MKRVLAWLAAALFGLAAFTGWALEAGDVAVLVTQRPDGRVRETHLVREGRRERLRVESALGPGAHARVRRLLREKYGPRDAWVGLLQDTSRSVAVRLHPRESAAGGGR